MRLLKEKCGSMAIWTFLVSFVLLTITGVVIELYRIHSVYEHVEYELQRAVNIAVEDSIDDALRIDGDSAMDAELAEEDFYNYLSEYLELDSAFQKTSGSKTVYSLEIEEFETTEEPAELLVTGNVHISSIFAFLEEDIAAPFEIRSRNARTD